MRKLGHWNVRIAPIEPTKLYFNLYASSLATLGNQICPRICHTKKISASPLISNLPEWNGFKHLVVCIDYFSKWTEAKALRDKKATSIAKFLYEVICRHGCIKIQINDLGCDFVNDVCTVLHEMTGAEQRVTSAYHLQANGLRQNRPIKEA